MGVEWPAKRRSENEQSRRRATARRRSDLKRSTIEMEVEK
jgi:hypothetical protein